MLKTFSITDIGKRRKLNQDYVYTSERPVGNLPNVFIVADGMGGHNAGDYASKYTVETIVREIAASFEVNPEKILAKAIEVANEDIIRLARENVEMEGMGTTVVAATCMGKYLRVANVGDSRLYVVGEKITQITRDHSLVEEMVRMGGIDRETARNHPDKNIITRAIGATEKVEVDFFDVELKPGEIVLMCSDGLTNMLEDEEIRMILNGQRDIVEKAEELVKAANNNGGKDNIAVVLIEPFAE
ncbi:MAG: Stp1/IreP family PP2C-type Ser/Thr phosphatase [Lachnospiraceae bacterium]|nr:Stp1/IreP family PP2C-type Ser/Thr phosphatase [Lachnospiraceae bacterium]MBQ7781610.1 Stp1/IreP family PP2C-type Ser/Thr phosphatase [Lachnospiraceae bacterium]